MFLIVKISKFNEYKKQGLLFGFCKVLTDQNLILLLNYMLVWKVFRNENIDYIISADKLVGVPAKAEIVDIGIGKSFIKRYKQKYDLT